MNRFFSRTGVLAVIFLLGFSAGCDEDEPPLPDNLANFAVSSTGIGDDVSEADITLNLSRAVSTDVPITISFTTEGVTYGEHFVTEPAASGNMLEVTIPANASSVSFKVIRNSDIFLKGDESVTFSIDDAGQSLVVGTTTEVKLSFSSIVSEGAQLTLNGIIADEAGSSAGNSVFVDLSENRQTPAARTSWDLGFYNGDDFRVIINNTAAATVIMVDATDLAAVSSSDINPEDLAVGHGLGTLELVDDPEGDISNTAIAAISATDSENKIYVINRVGGNGAIGEIEDLIKVRIVRKGEGYTVQYAKINETTSASADIEKTDTHTFAYFNFNSGAVAVEPEKDKWDIQWSWSMYRTDFGGGYIPYAFSDMVFVNHLNGVAAAEVMVTEAVTYDNFQESNLPAVTFSGSRNTIGSNWRVTSPTADAGVKTDRFYVIKDPAGNIYKLKFVSFHANDGGTRGKPVISYALVSKAE